MSLRRLSGLYRLFIISLWLFFKKKKKFRFHSWEGSAGQRRRRKKTNKTKWINSWRFVSLFSVSRRRCGSIWITATEAWKISCRPCHSGGRTWSWSRSPGSATVTRCDGPKKPSPSRSSFMIHCTTALILSRTFKIYYMSSSVWTCTLIWDSHNGIVLFCGTNTPIKYTRLCYLRCLRLFTTVTVTR